MLETGIKSQNSDHYTKKKHGVLLLNLTSAVRLPEGNKSLYFKN